MIYKETVFRPQGDANVLVEFGDEPSLLLSFRVVSLNSQIKARKILGVTETVVTTQSISVSYNPRKISYGKLISEIRKLSEEIKEYDSLPSRSITIPIWFDDPWSKDCAHAHLDYWQHEDCSSNFEFMAKQNNLSIDEIIRKITTTDWWVTIQGFTPGLFGALPLDPTYTLTVPSYIKPRIWTHERLFTILGKYTWIYTIRSPGGGQLLGRTPWNLYEPQQLNKIFKKSPVLVRVGDHIRYRPITEEQYWKTREQVEMGNYDYEDYIQPEMFSVKDVEQRFAKGP
ncbi:MAG: allophanate hydrolase subunit 1 [Candidatus Bathyarchaeia archaeon]